MNLFQLKYFATASKKKIVHILQRKKKKPTQKNQPKTLHVTVPEGQTQHLPTGHRQHYCSLNAIHYRLRNFFYAAGGL